MTFLKKIQEHKYLKYFTNRYILTLTVFIIWMLFFDVNSYVNQRKYDKEIEELRSAIEFYEKEIEKNKRMIETLKDPEQLEKYAREKYRIKKEDEVLYLIEFDTLN